MQRRTHGARLARWLGGVAAVATLLAAHAQNPSPMPTERQAFPQAGIVDPHTGQTFDSFVAYRQAQAARAPQTQGRPWVGVIVERYRIERGDLALPRALAHALDARGLNAAPVFGAPLHQALRRLYLDADGQSRIAALVLLSSSSGEMDDTRAVLQQLDVPVVNGIALRRKTREQWQNSAVGLTLGERFYQVFGPELAGAVAPTIVATEEEQVRDAATGLDAAVQTPVPERVQRLAARVHKLTLLQTTPNADKRVALMYYNDEPGPTHIEADSLNVPRSLWQTLQALEGDGYTLGEPPSHYDGFEAQLLRHGINVEPPGALAELVAAGKTVLLPLATYRQWLDEQAPALRQSIEAVWGRPEDAQAMLWTDAAGERYFVLPVLRFGQILLAPQPMRGWGLDIRRAVQIDALPPTHQYLAFFLWLQREFQPHAVISMGAHGSIEYLPGHDFGLTAEDASDVVIGDVPQFNPFLVSNQGDAMKARHRAMAHIITHLTPPVRRVALNSELLMLLTLIDDWVVARQQSDIAGDAARIHIQQRATELGLLKDIGVETLDDAADVEMLRDYIREISERTTTYGLHSFGSLPEPELRQPWIDAILATGTYADDAARERERAQLRQHLQASAPAELAALLHGLAGRYVAAGPGGNPVRTPAVLPTGRNMFSYDPYRLPTPGTWAQGRMLAEDFVRDWHAKHGAYPQRVSFAGLWDSLRSGGVAHAQMLALLGVRPVWDARGRVAGVERIPRAELGRPRVDVTFVPAGGGDRTGLIDQAVTLVKDLDEPDNPVRAHVLHATRVLQDAGIAPEEAARMAAVRVFAATPPAYGTGIDNVIPASNTWEDERQIAEVYFRRMGNLYGQGFAGDQPGGSEVGTQVFKLALSGTQAGFHNHSGDSVAVLDHSSVYRHLGGLTLAVRQIDGQTPQTMVLNVEGKAGKNETLDRFMGREMRMRYTNPEWVRAMMAEGHAGANIVMEINERLWAWQVVVPEVVDGAKWQEMYETYVADRNGLGVRDLFRAANNLLAYQAMVDRMLVAINKGYWQAAPEVKAELERVNREVIAEAGVACGADACSSPEITRLAQELDQRKLAAAHAPGYGLNAAMAPPESAPVAASAPQIVSGQQLLEVPVVTDAQTQWGFALIVLLAVLAGAIRQARLPCAPMRGPIAP